MATMLCTNFPHIARDILTTLILAEDAGKPLTLAEAQEKWKQGSTWEDLVDSDFISLMPDAVTVTERGKAWYISN